MAAVIARWDTLLDTLRERRQIHIQAFLREGRPVDVQGEVLTIEFPPDRGFHRASLDTDTNRPVVEGILGELTGFEVKITTVIAGESGGSTRSSGAATAGRGGNDTGNSGHVKVSSDPASPGVADDGGVGARETSGTRDMGAAHNANDVDGAAHDDATQHPAVKEALRVFGGKIVSVKRSED